MKKEIGIAVFFGILLGLIVAFFMIFQIRQTQSDNQPITSTISGPSVIKQQIVTDENFELIQPKTGEIVESKTITLKGKATKDSVLVIQSASGEKIVKLDDNQFAVPYDVAYGENVIHIAIYPKDANSHIQRRTITIFYIDKP